MLAAVLCSLVAVAASIPLELSGSAIDQWKIDAEGCGKRNPPYTRDAEHYVVGGSEASPYTYPFICALYYGTSQICGGSLIRNLAGNYWFVTAAHCVDSGAVAQYSIRCGVHDLRATSQPFEFKPAIQARIIHESYSSSTIKNDIALFRLSQTGFPRERISAVCIPTQDYREGENSTVLGWGTLREGGSSSSLLQVASKPVVSDTTCRTAYGSSFDANSMVCAGVYPTGGIDACQGDSGGPLVAERNGELQLIGIVSWGYGCARPYYPGVYSDVLRLKTWLNSKINA
ncbi:trypsin alpha-3-like [Pomacea canaliculata]|uniref:trypsin alpha-3-like n=1 Tax=Pomacea canaliculata TaxID=400727 RepID=UPI000D72DFA8|nr:trypsin alpha-3-like [Pomacea canaliculata]